MAGAVEVRIKGQRELEAAFLQVRREVLLELKPELLRIAEVVKADSTKHITTDGANRNVTGRWSQFRVGANVKGAWVKPAGRNRGGSKRPNFGQMMLTSMTEARDENQERLVLELDALVNNAGAKAGF